MIYTAAPIGILAKFELAPFGGCYAMELRPMLRRNIAHELMSNISLFCWMSIVS